MPSRVPDDVRSLVIQQWLKGELRDKIAADSGQSGGAVTNIISSWKQGLAVTMALLQLKQMASFFSGSSTSLSNGLIGLISIITYMTYSLNLVTQQRNVQYDKNAPTDIDFAPLVIAAKGEPGVDLRKLKVSLKKAIEDTQKNLDIDDSKLNEKLTEARLLLSSEQV